MKQYDYAAIARQLDRLRDVPDEVLWTVVTRDGLCFWAYDRAEMPPLVGDDEPDRALAERLCGGCPVMDECLEFELRKGGADTVGVWGAMAEQHRRELHHVWRAKRDQPRVWKRRHPNRRVRGGGDEQ